MIERFSKQLGRLLELKASFFAENDRLLERARDRAAFYRAQPLRARCKNCDGPVSHSDPSFTKFGVPYFQCEQCGHLNGAHDDSEAFCALIYSEEYGATYTEMDAASYDRRLEEIYLPKAQFLKDVVTEQDGSLPTLSDFGAGGGYFVAAAERCGFDAVGYEPIDGLVKLANRMSGRESVRTIGQNDLLEAIRCCRTPVVSFIGVLEHLQEPRRALQAIRDNPHIRYLFLGVPLFSPTVAIESVFDEVLPRHLVEDHTHLFTDRSLTYLEKEFGFERIAAWWFGLDAADLFRSVALELERHDEKQLLARYWRTEVYPLLDGIQAVFDNARRSSEVHLVLRKV